MKRRNIVRLVSFISAIAVALAGFIVVEKQKNARLMLQIENNYSRNLSQFSASLNNISLILKKARYANSPGRLNSFSAELLTEAEISKSALSQLPQGAHYDSLNRFLSQVGNYAFSVAEGLQSGKELPDDYKNNIASLSDTAQKVSQIVNTAQVNFDNPDYWTSEIEKEMDEKLDESLSESLSVIENEFGDYPTLVYDGPYSDHILQKEPEMLKDAELITEKTALEIACDFADIKDISLEIKGEQKGKLEAFHFGDDSVDITVTKRGGFPVFMRKNRTVGEYILSYKQALEKAKRFLEIKGLESFLESYYFVDEGVCVINFAFLDGQTICYTDLIKVGIAMDTGEVMLYEASGYISNHKSRAFATANHTLEEARQMVSSELKVVKSSIALIPTNKGTEERCYEFTCIDGENEVLVYINTLNLAEEEILILLKNDGGTLVK